LEEKFDTHGMKFFQGHHGQLAYPRGKDMAAATVGQDEGEAAQPLCDPYRRNGGAGAPRVGKESQNGLPRM